MVKTLNTIGGLSEDHPSKLTVISYPIKPDVGETITIPAEGGAFVVNWTCFVKESLESALFVIVAVTVYAVFAENDPLFT